MLTEITPYITRIHATICDCFDLSPFSGLLDDPTSLLSNQGKMLRSRMGLHLGLANGIDPNILIRSGAAIELIHTASLLHDDVIDNGHIRRGAPTYWKTHGVPGAILLGDLLMFYAMRILIPLQNQSLSEALLRFAGEMGEAEVQQELLGRGYAQTWNDCIETARHKTGPLFAFMGFTAGGEDPAVTAVLSECGYLIGTAYQLADDILDAYGQHENADKSLQRDHLRNKQTSAEKFGQENIDPRQFIEDLCSRSLSLLSDFPVLQEAWKHYLDIEINPVMRHFTDGFGSAV